MTEKIAEQIQAAQNHGRAKWGNGPEDTKHDDTVSPGQWTSYIQGHAERAYCGTPMEYRAELVKVAGLAVSAIEAFDRTAEAMLNDPARLSPGNGK